MHRTKAELNFKRVSLFLMMLTGSLLISETLLAGVIVKCQIPKSRVGKVCIVKSRLGKKGDQVVIKDRSKQLYWKATGVIVRDRGHFSIAAFSGTREFISKGDYAEVSSPHAITPTDWSASFSNHESFLDLE